MLCGKFLDFRNTLTMVAMHDRFAPLARAFNALFGKLTVDAMEFSAVAIPGGERVVAARASSSFTVALLGAPAAMRFGALSSSPVLLYFAPAGAESGRVAAIGSNAYGQCGADPRGQGVGAMGSTVLAPRVCDGFDKLRLAGLAAGFQHVVGLTGELRAAHFQSI